VKYRAAIAAALLAASAGHASVPDIAAPSFDGSRALQVSQAAIGRELSPDIAFMDQDGRRRNLGEFRGRPLIVSPVFRAESLALLRKPARQEHGTCVRTMRCDGGSARKAPGAWA